MDSKKILIIILVVILVIYLSAFIFTLAYMLKKIKHDESNQQNMMNLMNMNMMNAMNTMINNQNNNNQNQNQIPVTQTASASCGVDSPQTEFFKKSVDHAEKVLKTNVFLDGYKYRNSVDLTKIDEATKKSIIVAMQYMMIDPINSRNIEQRFRTMSDQENVPLWFVILHEAVKKLIPIENASQLTDEELLAEIEKRKLNQTPQNNNSEGSKECGIIIPITQVA